MALPTSTMAMVPSWKFNLSRNFTVKIMTMTIKRKHQAASHIPVALVRLSRKVLKLWSLQHSISSRRVVWVKTSIRRATTCTCLWVPHLKMAPQQVSVCSLRWWVQPLIDQFVLIWLWQVRLRHLAKCAQSEALGKSWLPAKTITSHVFACQWPTRRTFKDYQTNSRKGSLFTTLRTLSNYMRSASLTLNTTCPTLIQTQKNSTLSCKA